jgi:hypothetical protein
MSAPIGSGIADPLSGESSIRYVQNDDGNVLPLKISVSGQQSLDSLLTKIQNRFA